MQYKYRNANYEQLRKHLTDWTNNCDSCTEPNKQKQKKIELKAIDVDKPHLLLVNSISLSSITELFLYLIIHRNV